MFFLLDCIDFLVMCSVVCCGFGWLRVCVILLMIW